MAIVDRGALARHPGLHVHLGGRLVGEEEVEELVVVVVEDVEEVEEEARPPAPGGPCSRGCPLR